MEKDIEKQNGHLLVRLAAGETYPSHIEQGSPSPTFDRVVDPADPGEAQVATIRQSNGVLRWLRHAETWLDRKLNFEAMGVERMPESKRRPPEILNMLFFWFSLLFSPVLVPIGMLGPIFGLSVNTSIGLTIAATFIGTTVPAFTSTLCAPTGLRQIAVSRYAFGIWGAKICGLLNIIVNVGYAVISAVVGGQLISAVSGGSTPLAVGIVIITLIGFAISFLGFAAIHHYERYAWILAFILLCVTYGQSSAYFSPTPNLSIISGLDYTGACLSYFSVIFGVCCSWCSIAGDYYVHYPSDTNKWLVFGLTFLGQSIPTIFVGVLGNYFGGIILAHPELSDVYDSGGVGALFLAILHPSGWAKVACVLFWLSFLGNLIANIYSAALSIQLWGQHFIAIPRSVWCTLLSVIVIALALGGRDQLEAILNNLCSLLGYWTLAFGGVLFIEHFWFRPRLGGYDLTAWQDHHRMPWGAAGTGTLILGIGVSFLGMNQTWFMSPAARAIGAYGGDVGDYLVVVAVFLFYPFLRTFEVKFSGR